MAVAVVFVSVPVSCASGGSVVEQFSRFHSLPPPNIASLPCTNTAFPFIRPSSVTSIDRATTTRLASGTETLNSLGVPWYAGPCGAVNTYRFWVFALRAGAPVLAPPTNFFANGTSLPRPSLFVLAELASSALNCTMITTTYNHSSGGAGCSDPLASACTPSATTSTACPALTTHNVWALEAYFYTMRVNVPYQSVLAYKDALLAKTQADLGVSRARLVFGAAPVAVNATLTMVTLVIIERAPGSAEPDAADAAAAFLEAAAGEAEPDVQMLLRHVQRCEAIIAPMMANTRIATHFQLRQ